jgi:hypothetical protein
MGNGAVKFKFNEMFLCYTKIIARQYFCVVQLVGTKEEAANYRSQLTLIGANGVDEIVETFVVRSFAEDFSDSFQSAKCFVIDEGVLWNLNEDGRLRADLELLKIKN